MTPSKLLRLLISIFWQLYCVNGSCAYSDWALYNDEKCFKVFGLQFVTKEEANNFCNWQVTGASLLTITSREEQAFVEKYIFDDTGILDNVWLGGKRNLTGDFYWSDDNSLFEYTNWAPEAPSNDQEKECVQMAGRLHRGSKTAQGDGFWSDVSCLTRKIVVCQAPSVLSLAEIQKISFENRKRVLYLENNPVPIGFIYVQLANQPTPSSLWPSCNWIQVTSNYSGQFFRAEGGNSASFGTTQTDNSPKLKSAQTATSAEALPSAVEVTPGIFSSAIWTGEYETEYTTLVGVKFLVDYTDNLRPEVRPINSAVRIWVRTV